MVYEWPIINKNIKTEGFKKYGYTVIFGRMTDSTHTIGHPVKRQMSGTAYL